MQDDVCTQTACHKFTHMCRCYILYLISIIECVCKAEHVFCNKFLHRKQSALYDLHCRTPSHNPADSMANDVSVKNLVNLARAQTCRENTRLCSGQKSLQRGHVSSTCAAQYCHLDAQSPADRHKHNKHRMSAQAAVTCQILLDKTTL